MTVIITLNPDELREAVVEYCKNVSGVLTEKSKVEGVLFNGEKSMTATAEFNQ